MELEIGKSYEVLVRIIGKQKSEINWYWIESGKVFLCISGLGNGGWIILVDSQLYSVNTSGVEVWELIRRID